MIRHPFRYTVNGLVLACDVPLEQPGLRRDATDSSAPPDVVVDWDGATTPPASGPVSRRIVEATGGWLEVSEGEGALLRFGYADQHVQFAVSQCGDRVGAAWTSGVLPAHACTLLLTTVLGYLLHRHGRLALHAGVVARHGSAFVLAGDQGAGKSTTMAALAAQGCTVVSDDVAALVRRPSGWAVHRGLAGLRLTPAAQAVLGVPAAGLVWPRSPRMGDTEYADVERKAVAVVGSPAGDEPLPLGGVFLLPPRRLELKEPRIEAVHGAATVPCLARRLLTPAWLTASMDPARFASLADLAGVTPLRVVERPDDLAALPALCDELLDEMGRLGG